MNIQDISDQELRSELERREHIREEKQRIENMQRATTILQYIDTLINLSHHSKTSCSDENPCNHWRNECPRCSLIFAKKDNYVGFDVSIKICNFAD